MKTKIKIEDRVTPAGVLGLVVWLMMFMLTANIVVWVWLDPTLALFLMIPIGGALLIFGIEKPSIFKFALDGLRILGDESLTIAQRIAMCRELLSRLVGLTVDLSELDNALKKELEDQKPEWEDLVPDKKPE